MVNRQIDLKGIYLILGAQVAALNRQEVFKWERHLAS